MVQNDRNLCLLHSIFQEPYIMWLPFMVRMCKMIISPCVFLNFFKISIFQVVRGLKGQSMAQNDKKVCPSHSISQKPYIIWSSFMVHMCKMIIYLSVFLIFSNFWFFSLFGGSKHNKWSKMSFTLQKQVRNVCHTLH